jgi:hypothetical protein
MNHKIIIEVFKYKLYKGYIKLNNIISFDKIIWKRYKVNTNKVIGIVGEFKFEIRLKEGIERDYGFATIIDYDVYNTFNPNNIKSKDDLDKFLFLTINIDEKDLIDF